ncbi:MAG: diacylglycerol kinase family lipid kinase [bacterium]|nr:diacylglycerol kinase family lipid kinase [bacterium]
MLEPFRQFKMIINPISGAGRGLKEGRRLARLLLQEGIAVEIFITRQPQDAEKEARQSQIPLIVVGGDGTVNEVINGLAGRDIPLAVFPVGTANILAREFHLPRNPAAFLSIIRSARVRLLDAGQICGQMVTRRFLMVASLGLDAEVTRIMRRSRSGPIHLSSYLIPLWNALKHYHYSPFTLRIDDRIITPPATTAVIGNIRNYGGFFSITHRARPDDGWLDICVFSGNSRRDYLRYLMGALWRRPSIFSDVVYCRGKKIDLIKAPRPIPVELDGDFFGYTPLTCTIIPHSISLFLPA